jgi:hypothetical protein
VQNWKKNFDFPLFEIQYALIPYQILRMENKIENREKRLRRKVVSPVYCMNEFCVHSSIFIHTRMTYKLQNERTNLTVC